MASVPRELVWEIVKRNDAFLVKQIGNGNAKVQFSKERNNLYNLNSFKYFELANKKTVSVQPGGKDLSVVLTATKTKKQSKPTNLNNRSVLKKEFSKMAKVVVNQVAENAALARLNVVHRSLKIGKSRPKKRNRQARKVNH